MAARQTGSPPTSGCGEWTCIPHALDADLPVDPGTDGDVAGIAFGDPVDGPRSRDRLQPEMCVRPRVPVVSHHCPRSHRFLTVARSVDRLGLATVAVAPLRHPTLTLSTAALFLRPGRIHVLELTDALLSWPGVFLQSAPGLFCAPSVAFARPAVHRRVLEISPRLCPTTGTRSARRISKGDWPGSHCLLQSALDIPKIAVR